METMILGTYSMLDQLELRTEGVSAVKTLILPLVSQLKEAHLTLHSVSYCVEQQQKQEGEKIEEEEHDGERESAKG